MRSSIATFATAALAGFANVASGLQSAERAVTESDRGSVLETPFQAVFSGPCPTQANGFTNYTLTQVLDPEAHPEPGSAGFHTSGISAYLVDGTQETYKTQCVFGKVDFNSVPKEPRAFTVTKIKPDANQEVASCSIDFKSELGTDKLDVMVEYAMEWPDDGKRRPKEESEFNFFFGGWVAKGM